MATSAENADGTEDDALSMWRQLARPKNAGAEAAAEVAASGPHLPDAADDSEVTDAAPRPPWKGIFGRRGNVRPPYNPNLEAFWYRRRELFSKFDRGVRIDAESWFSVTPERLAAHIAARMCTRRGLLVVDPFCGCGGNVIQQALADPSGAVLAIDIDPHKISMARHNARMYGVEHRILFVVGDALAMLPTLKADAVFLSPPWGGLDYDEGAAEADFDLSADMRPCCGFDLFDAACAAAPAVAYYLPKNTDRAQIAQMALRHPSRACELQHVVRHSAAIKKPKSAGRKPKSKVCTASLARLHPPHPLRV